MSTVTPSEPTVNYPQSRYEIEYEVASKLFACSYGGEVFDRASCYDDAHMQCGYHWIAQQAIDATTTTAITIAGTFTVTMTRKQIVIAASDGSKTFHQRTERGRAAAERRVARLQAAGFQEVTHG